MPRFLHLQLHLLVVLFATTAVLGYWISLPAPGLVAWRTALAAAGGAVLVALWQKRSLRPPEGMLFALLGVGALVGLHWICFFGAIRLSNVSICLAGMATTSFFTALTEPLLERRPVKPLELWLGLLVLGGILLVAGFERGHLAGLAVALGGALLAAVFPVLNRQLVRRSRMDPLLMVTWEMLGACAVSLLAVGVLDGAAAYAGLLELRGLDLLWLIVLAWVCTVFGYGFHIHLLKYLSAFTTNLAVNFEPVYGILAAAVLFGEHRDLSPGFFAGAAVIVMANIAHPLVLRRIARRKGKVS